MSLHRIRAASSGAPALPQTNLDLYNLRLAAGRVLLNRFAEQASALIVMQGWLQVGVSDETADLTVGGGVLLPSGTAYSLRAQEDVVAMLFELPADAARRAAPDSSD